MEIDEIKQRRLEELQGQLEQQQQEETQLHQQISQIELIIKQKLTKDALSRLGNIKVGYPEKYIQLLAILGQLIQKVNVVNDNMLKDILIKLQLTHKFSIKRK